MKCKRLCAWLLSLVMMFSLLPVSAAAAGTDVGSKAYDEIRIYLDAETKTDFDNLEGTLTKQVRIISPEYSGGDTLCFHNIEKTYWYAPNIIRKVTANDITRIDLVRDKALGHSSKIQIPIGGNLIYKVTISEGGSAKFLRIDITKRTPHAVKYVFASPAPETVPAPVDPAKYTETSSVTLLDPAEKSVTGTHEGRTGLWTFDGWTVKGDHTNTQISQADKKFIMPDEDVTVTGTWTFTSDPTPVYVYFKTVNTKNELVKVESGVTYNANGSSWATLGKLVTATTVTPEKKNILGAEVKTSSNFVKHDSNKDFDLDWISEWVDLKRDNGAAGYESEVPFGTHVWHLDGQVNVCKLSYDANRPAGVTADVTVPDSAYYLPNWNAPVSTDDPTLQDYNFGGWYKEPECVNEAKEKVAVAEDTVLYAKWTPLAQPTADLIDDNITIKHGVNGAPADDDDTDTTAHIVKKDAKISYQATLDMQNLEFGVNPEHADTVFKIKKLMQDAGTTSLWEFMMGNPIVMFTGSEVNLHVKFSDNLDTSSIDWSKLSLISDWFRLADGYQNGLTKDSNGYWTIPCVIKAEKGTNNSPIINLSGITLSLTDKAQGKLNSNTALDITSEGYIDGTIKISTKILNEIITYELSLIGKSKDDPVKNTAKLKLAVPTYTVTYTDGANGSAFKDQVYSGLKSGVATPAFNGTPTRSGYTFNGWTPAVAKTVTGDATYTATWSQNSSHDDDDGIALFGVDNKNSYDGIWYYAEVTAPEGYVLDRTEYEINAKDFSDSLSTAVRDADTVRNYRGTTPDLLNDSDHFAYVIGYMDGNVRPYGLISRAETTTIFFRLLKDSVRDGNLLTSNTYTDVADDYWANTAISTMTGLGIVQGRSTTTFDPKAPITRAQFAAICARFDTGKSSGEQTFSDIQGHWAEKYIERAAELGWIKGFEDGTFRPDAYITRAQAMTMINRVLNRIPEDESDLLPGMNVWPDCNPGDWFYLTVQEATNSHDFEHKAGSYETWTRLTKDPDWTRYEN